MSSEQLRCWQSQLQYNIYNKRCNWPTYSNWGDPTLVCDNSKFVLNQEKWMFNSSTLGWTIKYAWKCSSSCHWIYIAIGIYLEVYPKLRGIVHHPQKQNHLQERKRDKNNRARAASSALPQHVQHRRPTPRRKRHPWEVAGRTKRFSTGSFTKCGF